MERCFLEHGFGPFYRPDSRILILGSFPSAGSRKAQFFYGHPQNRFWKVLAAVFEDCEPLTREEKEAFLERHRIALYDVIERCSIIGSADSTIRDVVPADIASILRVTRVGERVFVNGKTAERFFERYQAPALGFHAGYLPSTSPANAAFSTEKLTAIWSGRILPAL